MVSANSQSIHHEVEAIDYCTARQCSICSFALCLSGPRTLVSVMDVKVWVMYIYIYGTWHTPLTSATYIYLILLI